MSVITNETDALVDLIYRCVDAEERWKKLTEWVTGARDDVMNPHMASAFNSVLYKMKELEEGK